MTDKRKDETIECGNNLEALDIFNRAFREKAYSNGDKVHLTFWVQERIREALASVSPPVPEDVAEAMEAFKSYRGVSNDAGEGYLFDKLETHHIETIIRVARTPTNSSMEDAVTREDTDVVGALQRTSSTTDGDAERLIKYLESSLPQIIYSVKEDGSRLLMDYQADMMAEIIIGSIKALQSTRKPPVDTIAVPRDVLQGVRDNLRIFEATTKAGLSGSGLSERSCWSLNDNANKALASLDAVLSEGES